MKRSSYMSKNELIDFLKIGVLAGECAAIAERTPEKDWRQKMKTAATYLGKITEERLFALDVAQLLSVDRRRKTTQIVLHTEDQKRFTTVEKEVVSVDLDDLETLAELALNSCMACPEGECVKACRFRLAMHKLGITVAREDAVDGRCEYKYQSVTKAG